jgi:hypothetical protein
MLILCSSFVEKCCPNVVSAFVHVWHPDALDTLDNYFGSTSHFVDTRENLWTTSITISHWRLIDHGQLADPSDPFYEGGVNAGRKDAIFPPPEFANTGMALEERSSSLVMTGDATLMDITGSALSGRHWPTARLSKGPRTVSCVFYIYSSINRILVDALSSSSSWGTSVRN